MRAVTAVIAALMLSLCACTKTLDASKVIEKAEAGETLTDEEFKVLSNYVNSAMTSDEAKALSDASANVLHNPTAEATEAMQRAVERMEKRWPLLQQASLLMASGGAMLPLNEVPRDTLNN